MKIDPFYVLVTFIKSFYMIIVTLWPIWLVAIACAIIQRVIYLWKDHRLRLSGMNEIDKMDGKTFERRLAVMFKDLGYKVKLTKATGDFGADLIIINHATKTAVQAKRHSKSVGVKAIQEVVGSLAKYDCQKGMVVTNNYFTQAAKDLAKHNNVELWDRDKLMKVLMSLKKKAG